jgi:hypothetical protein
MAMAGFNIITTEERKITSINYQHNQGRVEGYNGTFLHNTHGQGSWLSFNMLTFEQKTKLHWSVLT